MYFYNWMVLGSKAINTIRGGTPHESLSQWLGRKERENPYSPYSFYASVVNCVFYILFKEEDHIKDALDGENKSKDIWDA